MNNIYTDYLKKYWKNLGRIKVCYISYSRNWDTFQKIDNSYPSITVNIYDCSTANLGSYNLVKQNYDIILLSSPKPFQASEYEKLNQIASYIATTKNKKVTVGYNSIIPREERKVNDLCLKINLASYEADECVLNCEYDRSILFSERDLLDLVLYGHYEVNEQKTLKR